MPPIKNSKLLFQNYKKLLYNKLQITYKHLVNLHENDLNFIEFLLILLLNTLQNNITQVNHLFIKQL